MPQTVRTEGAATHRRSLKWKICRASRRTFAPNSPKLSSGSAKSSTSSLLVLVCGGHALIEGVPGIAKTLAVKTLARICGFGFQRVQCTADLMPADVIGTNVFNMATSAFTLHRGPIFTDLLLVDEINRTSPRTQAALLEAMEERQVTIDGVRYPLPANFTVLATQNPVEFEGTYPLPEAQLDRFLLKIRVDYPSAEEEDDNSAALSNAVLIRASSIACPSSRSTGVAGCGARRKSRRVRVETALYRYIVNLVRRTRDWPAISLGASPRAAIGCFSMWRAPCRNGGPRFSDSRRHQSRRARRSSATGLC